MRGGQPAFLLDGDNLRHGLNSDLGFSTAIAPRTCAEQAKWRHLRRGRDAGPHRADLPLRRGPPAIRACTRRRGCAFAEVFVDTSVEVCEHRDPKGLYARARAGQLPGFTGVDSAYEIPQNPELVLGSEAGSLPERVARVLELLEGLLR